MPRLQKCASARRKCASPAVRGNMSLHGDHNDDDDFMDPPPRLNIPVKFTPPTSRCTPISVSSIVKTFNDEKKNLVSDMGFRGMLKLPDIVNNREFGHWTLSRVSCDDVAIKLEDGTLLPFSDEDIYKVLDIPFTGKELLTPSNEEIADIKRIICQRFKVPDWKSVNRSVLDDILSRQYNSPMSDDEKAAFKTAFIILVMTKFLAPQALLDNICPRYFTSLRDLNDMPNWNWDRYIIGDIISAARALGNRCSYVNGCVIFLQVFYLDNVDFGHLNMKHVVFPRIAKYDADAIKIRRNLDIKEKDPYKPTQFGKLKEATYLWEDDDDRFSVENIPLYDSADDEPTSIRRDILLAEDKPSTQESNSNTVQSTENPETASSNDFMPITLEPLMASADELTPMSVEPPTASSDELTPMTIEPLRAIPMGDFSANGSTEYGAQYADDTLQNSTHKIAKLENQSSPQKNNHHTELVPVRSEPRFRGGKAKRGLRKQLNVADICDRLASAEAREEILYCDEMKKQAAAEIDALYDEIRPAIEEHERDSQDNVSTSLAEQWIEASCSKYKAEFDLSAAIIKNMASTPLRAKEDAIPREQNGLLYLQNGS